MEGRTHLPVRVRPFLPDHGDLRFGRPSEDLRSRMTHFEGDVEGRSRALGQALLFGFDVIRIGLKPVELKARFLPDVSKLDHVLVEDGQIANRHADPGLLGDRPDGFTGNSDCPESLQDTIGFLARGLENKAQLLGKEDR